MRCEVRQGDYQCEHEAGHKGDHEVKSPEYPDPSRTIARLTRERDAARTVHDKTLAELHDRTVAEWALTGGEETKAEAG
jgi:hypothetical protein